jgi:SAM-dependent methyltransferase
MTNPPNPARHVVSEAMGYMYAAALRAAALLSVADQLADGPRDAAELAEITGADAGFLRRLLRYLATRQIFREDEEGRFHLTPCADVLRADSPTSIRTGVLAVTSDLYWLPSGHLVDAIRSGRPGFDRHFGRPFFDYLAENPSLGAMFAEGMAQFSVGDDEYVTANHAFPDTGVVVDVGGGLGGLLLAVLRGNPGLSGVLLDHEKVVAATVLDQLAAPDRWAAVAGDFFESVPAGDVYLLRHVLHDWTDDQCVRILSNCRRAMRPGGTVLAIDAVISPGNEPHIGKQLDMFMLLFLTGQERTRPEFETLFGRAGLRVTRVIPTDGPFAVIEAEAAG